MPVIEVDFGFLNDCSESILLSVCTFAVYIWSFLLITYVSCDVEKCFIPLTTKWINNEPICSLYLIKTNIPSKFLKSYAKLLMLCYMVEVYNGVLNGKSFDALAPEFSV